MELLTGFAYIEFTFRKNIPRVNQDINQKYYLLICIVWVLAIEFFYVVDQFLWLILKIVINEAIVVIFHVENRELFVTSRLTGFWICSEVCF